MFKVYCDFNDSTADDLFWLLYLDGKPLADAAGLHGLQEGDRVILFQDVGDFEVEATLHFNIGSPYFLGPKLCARPDWPTRRDGGPTSD